MLLTSYLILVGATVAVVTSTPVPTDSPSLSWMKTRAIGYDPREATRKVSHEQIVMIVFFGVGAVLAIGGLIVFIRQRIHKRRAARERSQEPDSHQAYLDYLRSLPRPRPSDPAASQASAYSEHSFVDPASYNRPPLAPSTAPPSYPEPAARYPILDHVRSLPRSLPSDPAPRQASAPITEKSRFNASSSSSSVASSTLTFPEPVAHSSR